MKVTYREALREALIQAIKEDTRTFLMGEDVGAYGGTYAVSKGMLKEFGAERIRDTPLSELGFTGLAIGAAIAGMRPIVEIMTVNFSLLALDQIINSAACLSRMSGGQFNVPLVIRMTTGGGRQLAAQHSNSFEGWFSHIPGLKILAPSTVEDARYMLAEAIKDLNPILIFEHALLFNREEDCPERSKDYNAFKSQIRRIGSDLSLITYGGTLPRCLEAAEILNSEGHEIEVIDLRCLRPLDNETIFNSVKKTHKAIIVDEGWRSVSLSSEISARITENIFKDLSQPVQRLCRMEIPIPYAKHLEEAAIPQVSAIVKKIKEML